MLFLLSCLCGNSSNASSERPTPATHGSIPQAASPLGGSDGPGNAVTMGGEAVTRDLISDRDQTAQDFADDLKNESRYHALYHDAIVDVAAEPDTSEETIIAVQLGALQPAGLQSASQQKKSVSFNAYALEREFRPTKIGGERSSEDTFTLVTPDKMALEREEVEKIAHMGRKFIWSAKHSADVLQSALSQANVIVKEGLGQGSQKQLDRVIAALEDGRQGMLLMQAMLDRIEGSSTVKLVRQKFLAAGFPSAERGLVEDAEQRSKLELVDVEIRAIANELPALSHLLKGLRGAGSKTRDSGEREIARLVKKALMSEGMAALSGVDVPLLPQRALLHTFIVDDSTVDVTAGKKPVRISLAEEGAGMSLTWAPIQIWGEFLSGLDQLATQIAEGAALSAIAKSALMTALQNTAPSHCSP